MSGLSFWELHRCLGQVYELELQELRELKGQVTTERDSSYRDLQTSNSLAAYGTDSFSLMESTTTSFRAGSKVRFVQPPESIPQVVPMVKEECASLESVEGRFESGHSIDGVMKDKGKTLPGSPGVPRVSAQDTLQSAVVDSDQTYQVRKNWTQKGIDETVDEVTPTSLKRRTSCTLPTVTSFKDEALESSPSWLKAAAWMVQHPASRFRVWWVPLGMLLLAYDVITIPLRFFGLEESPTITVISWFARLYWSMDMVLSFTSGFYDAGLLIVDFRRTAKNYLKGWFVFDLAVVSLDWVLLVINDTNEDAEGVPRLSKTMRITRLFRLARLGRLLKVGAITESFQEQLSSEAASIHYSIVRIILWLVVMSHVIACCWFGVSGLEDGSTWVQQHDLENGSVALQYATSLHWAVAQLGVGQTEIEAVTLTERIFSIIVMFLALISFSTLVSSMTSLKARLDQLKTEEVFQFRSLRRFLAEHAIGQELSHRVMRFLQHSLDVKKSVQVEDPQVLEMLSVPLQGELQLERHKPCFQKNAFFRQMLEHGGFHHIRELRSVAMGCMNSQILASGDVIFAAGSGATSCFFLEKGAFWYASEKSRHEKLCHTWIAEMCLWMPWLYVGDLVAKEKLCHTWIAEMCLWMPWLYVGDLVAKDTSRLISVNLATFCSCVGRVEETREMAASYAREYVDALNKRKDPLSDLWEDLMESDLPKESKSLKSVVFSRILPLD